MDKKEMKLILAKQMICNEKEYFIKNSEMIFLEYHGYFSKLKQEHFCICLLNNRHHIIGFETVSIGTINQSLVHPREVFAPAIEARAKSIILMHNHPGGDCGPSTQDIDITNRLVKCGGILGIEVIDHIIFGNEYFSFLDEDMLRPKETT